MYQKAFIRDGTMEVERFAADPGDLTRAVLRDDGIPDSKRLNMAISVRGLDGCAFSEAGEDFDAAFRALFPFNAGEIAFEA